MSVLSSLAPMFPTRLFCSGKYLDSIMTANSLVCKVKKGDT